MGKINHKQNSNNEEGQTRKGNEKGRHVRGES
jgi:hypothetical protein